MIIFNFLTFHLYFSLSCVSFQLFINLRVNYFKIFIVKVESFLTAPYFHFDCLATIYLLEVFPKKYRMGRSMHRIRRPNIGSSNYWSVLYIWLIDLGPRSRGFYTGLTELPKIHPKFQKECLDSGHPQRLYTFKNLKSLPCLIEDPWGRRFSIFSNRIFCSDFITRFFNMQKFTQRPYGRKRFPGQVSKSFEC